MIKIFVTLLNMSIVASYVAFFVIVVRLLLKKTPKIFSYGLWAIVFFRMVCPFSFENIFSLLPKSTNTISQDIIYSQSPTIATKSPLLNGIVHKTIQSTLPPVQIENSVTTMGIILEFSTYIWCLGIIILLTYSIFSYFRLKSKLSTATLVEQNIFETDFITSPFVMGFIKPKIYLPVDLLESDKQYILLHEKVHIKRFDYLVKPLALLATAIHWFNPLMWLSYKLMSKDMEMSCDEKVLKTMGDDIKIGYSNTLLSFSEKQSGLLSPLAFGEHNTKSRIKNVLNYKRPTFWVLLIVVVAVIAMSIGLLSNPKTRKEETVVPSKVQEKLTPKKTTTSESNMFSDITKIEIKYSYFNNFENDYNPYVIEDKTIINTITQMMNAAVIVTDGEATEVDRTNNPHATISIYKRDIKTEIPYIIDDLYSKSVFEYESKHYSPSFDLARLVENLEGFRPKDGNIEKPVQDFLKLYNWNSAFEISSTEVKLPDNLLQKAGEFPTKIYWNYNLQLSKDIDLDFSSYLGKIVTAELYYLINPLPEDFFPMQNAMAVILKQNGKIIGGYINAGRHSGFACSLKRKSFLKVTQEIFPNWIAKNGYDMKDQTNIKNSKLSPEEVVNKYFEAINRDDNSKYQYVDSNNLVGELFRNMDNTKLYNPKWSDQNTKSIKLLKIEKDPKNSPDGQITFNIEVDIKVKKFITMESGIMSYILTLKKEGDGGWKINEMGQ